MFWRFGHNASSIDALLDKDDISLDALLDEDDLLQECKNQNTRLIDYFQRTDVLKRLFGYVVGEIEMDENVKFKYPYVATEVLCSDIWSIVETCLNKSDELLAPFWSCVLDRDPEVMKSQNILASQFAKINATYLTKKPMEMLAFIQSQSNVVERILHHIETPAFVDLLVRIIQLDETPAGAGVLEWLSAERLIPRLVELLSPYHGPAMHAVVSDLVKGIISMSAPSPGAGLSEGLHNGPASNLFARQLAKRDNVEKLTGFMLDDYSFEIELIEKGKKETSPSTSILSPTNSNQPPIPGGSTLPNVDSAASSGIHAISIIIELIRKNNSDYFEPYLFHTLRNRLIQVQQQVSMHTEGGRGTLEQAFKEMANRMGVVHLGPLLDIMCDRLERFQQLLHKPRNGDGEIATTIGRIVPLTFERFRICELYAELLHCSNMMLLNRAPEFDNLYDSEGRLTGSLSALDDLSQVITTNTETGDQGNLDADEDEMEPAEEFPVSGSRRDRTGLEFSDDDEDMTDEGASSDDDVMEEIDMNDELPPSSTPPPASPLEDRLHHPPLIVPSSPNAASLPPPSELAAQGAAMARGGFPRTASLSSLSSRPASAGSRRSTRRAEHGQRLSFMPMGDKLKQRFAETRVLTTLLDLFFAFPWNNFLHGAVYDVIHQILTGKVDVGYNRELTIALFRDAKLLNRILEAQRQNDINCTQPKHVRLGYMGHLTLISEDVIIALEHYPPELRLILAQYAPQPEWDDYVGGRYHETKTRDTSLLGGGKPAVSNNTRGGAAKWRVDEADVMGASSGAVATNNPVRLAEVPSGIKGEFRRTNKLTREPSADFNIASFEADEDERVEDRSGPSRFVKYAPQEMSDSTASLSDGSDDDDEGGSWLTQTKFNLRPPPVSVSNHSTTRRPLDPSGFEESFNPVGESTSPFDDRFGFDDDGFGPFTDAAAASNGSSNSDNTDPFSFHSMSDDTDGSNSFDHFGDFGDFQTGDGDLTPTGGSWTFASDASFGSGSDDAEFVVEETNPSGSLSTSPTNTRGRIENNTQTSGFSDPYT